MIPLVSWIEVYLQRIDFEKKAAKTERTVFPHDLPRVFRSSREASPAPSLGADSSPQAKTMLDKGADYYEIPAFLRKQAD
jgi:cell division protein FtsZ